MTAEENKLRKERFARIRLVKRLLRPLPRRATVHRYPVLKWFAKTARARSYLWSFRTMDIVPALYVGWILTLMPAYGLQFVFSFVLALIFRCNLMVMIGLQMISNPITIVPLWSANFFVGDFFLSVLSPDWVSTVGAVNEIQQEQGQVVSSGLNSGLRVFASICFGGLIIGYFAGFISSFIYQFTASRASKSYIALRMRSSEIAKERASRAHKKSQTSNATHRTVIPRTKKTG